jgi:hypothetical protein
MTYTVSLRDGLDFIDVTFDAQWAEQDRRLAALKCSQPQPFFTTLGAPHS